MDLQKSASDVPAPNDNQRVIPPRLEAQYFADISGENEFGRPKARFMMRYYISYSDGTEDEIENLVIEKPIFSIFKHAGFVNVRMDFEQSIDQDLRDVWEMLEEYSQPINSVSYLPEEIESGYYTDSTGEHLVFFPMIDLTISPIGKEKDYVMLGINPAFYTLQPRDPSGVPCVIQLTFPEDWFVVTESPTLDVDDIQREVVQELGIDPNEPS